MRVYAAYVYTKLFIIFFVIHTKKKIDGKSTLNGGYAIIIQTPVATSKQEKKLYNKTRNREMKLLWKMVGPQEKERKNGHRTSPTPFGCYAKKSHV